MKFRQLFDVTFWKFIVVGIINTIIGTGTMFIAYNVVHFNYWVSSALNYIVGSICSYFLNKNFTFQNKTKDKKIIVKFIINISACYVIAYGLAKPLANYLLLDYPVNIQENIAMLAGMCFFVILNYVGQRFWAFK